MGEDVARNIQEALKLTDLPGAVQIRIGGVKGMLSLNYDIQADAIGIRPSQIKFSSSHTVLEVKRVAKRVDRTNKFFKEALLVSFGHE